MSQDSTEHIDDLSILTSGKHTQHTVLNSSNAILSSDGQGQVVTTFLNQTLQIKGKSYQIQKLLAKSGESEVYLAAEGKAKRVLKLYFRNFRPKDDILKTLLGLQHPDIIPLLDYDYYQGQFCEILEYAEGGSLEEHMPIQQTQQLKDLIAETINALDFCHQNGIIHRDIKPHNIFYKLPNQKDIVIGDFGISSVIDEGKTRRFNTSQARTAIYAAPEIISGAGGKTVVGKEVDYYALGITLLHLWSGEDPFKGVAPYRIPSLKLDGKVNIPADMPPEFVRLIRGLITVEPSKRWGLDEVKRWLKGEKIEVFFQEIDIQYKPFVWGTEGGMQLVANNPAELSQLMKQYPTRAKGHLYRQTISHWLRDANPGLYVDLMNIIETEYPGRNPEEKQAGLTKAIYLLNPESPYEAFDGNVLVEEVEFAQHFTLHFDHYLQEFSEPFPPFFLFLDVHDQTSEARRFRNLFQDQSTTYALNSLILSLEGEDRFIIGAVTIFQPKEILLLPPDVQQSLVSQLEQADSKLSIWLSQFTHLDFSIDQWRNEERRDIRSLRYALKEGYQFANQLVHNPDSFLQLLLSHAQDMGGYDPQRHRIQDLISFGDNEINDEIEEAEYWANVYLQTSILPQLSQAVQSGTLSSVGFLPLFSFLVAEDPVATLQQLIHLIKQYGEADAATFKALVQITAESLQLQMAQGDIFNQNLNLVKLSEQEKQHYPRFYDALFAKIDPLFQAGIQQRIHALSDQDDSQLSNLLNETEQLFSSLQAQSYPNDSVRKYQKVKRAIAIRGAREGKDIMREKNKKLRSLNDRFQQILDDQISHMLIANKKKYRKKILTNLGLAVLMILFLFLGIYFFFDYTSGRGFAQGIGIFFGVVGAICGLLFLSESVGAAFIAAIIGWFLGSWIGGLIGSFLIGILYFTSKAWVLQLLSIGGFVFFVYRLTQIHKDIDQSVNTIQLSSANQHAYQQGLQTIQQAEQQAISHQKFQTLVELLQMSESDLDKIQ